MRLGTTPTKHPVALSRTYLQKGQQTLFMKYMQCASISSHVLTSLTTRWARETGEGDPSNQSTWWKWDRPCDVEQISWIASRREMMIAYHVNHSLVARERGITPSLEKKTIFWEWWSREGFIFTFSWRETYFWDQLWGRHVYQSPVADEIKWNKSVMLFQRTWDHRKE